MTITPLPDDRGVVTLVLHTAVDLSERRHTAANRPYRPAVPQETVVAELRDGAGVRYDAEAVDACLRLIETGFAFSDVAQ